MLIGRSIFGDGFIRVLKIERKMLRPYGFCAVCKAHEEMMGYCVDWLG